MAPNIAPVFNELKKTSFKLQHIHFSRHTNRSKNGLFLNKRKTLRNPAWIIFNDNPTTRIYQSYDHEVNRISLLITENLFPLDACCHIYGNKVAFYSYRQNDLTGILIENDHMYQSQQTLFKMSWNLACQLPGNERYIKVDLPKL